MPLSFMSGAVPGMVEGPLPHHRSSEQMLEYCLLESHLPNFDQIESPSPIGEWEMHGLKLDWKRFVTHQTRDFMRWEIQALRDGGTANQ